MAGYVKVRVTFPYEVYCRGQQLVARLSGHGFQPTIQPPRNGKVEVEMNLPVDVYSWMQKQLKRLRREDPQWTLSEMLAAIINMQYDQWKRSPKRWQRQFIGKEE